MKFQLQQLHARIELQLRLRHQQAFPLHAYVVSIGALQQSADLTYLRSRTVFRFARLFAIVASAVELAFKPDKGIENTGMISLLNLYLLGAAVS